MQKGRQGCRPLHTVTENDRLQQKYHLKTNAAETGGILCWNQSLFSHCWLAMPQLVLQADWQEVWHSPQPPFLALSHRSRVSMVLMCSTGIPSNALNLPYQFTTRANPCQSHFSHKSHIYQCVDWSCWCCGKRSFIAKIYSARAKHPPVTITFLSQGDLSVGADQT